MAKQKGFLERCDHWRTRVQEGILGDINEGRIQNELKGINDGQFLALPNNLCLRLNVDWFNLYKENPYSVGAIYICVLNLYRKEHFKDGNMILVGMIPSPNEPKQHINTFLSPMVRDLQLLYDGVTIRNSSTLLGLTTITATLACIACDLPATRKVCGFSNFNATFGCSKCMNEFLTSAFGSKPLYGGFDYENWTAQDIDTHKSKALKCQEAHASSDCTAVLRKCGVKYSELLLILHFNVVHCHIIDPMHFIFLELAKHTIQTWKKGVYLMPVT